MGSLLLFLIFLVLLGAFIILTPVIRLIQWILFGSTRLFGNRQRKEKPSTVAGRKVFSKTDGEYIKFKEIQPDTACYSETAPDNGTDTLTQESQTEDVEWEEI